VTSPIFFADAGDKSQANHVKGRQTKMNKSQRGERFGQDGRDRDEESIVTCQEDGRGGEADQLPPLPHGACFAATESLLARTFVFLV